MAALKMSPVLMIFKCFPYQLPNREYLITIVQIFQFLVLPVNFWVFRWKPRDSTANAVAKWQCIKLRAIFFWTTLYAHAGNSLCACAHTHCQL